MTNHCEDPTGFDTCCECGAETEGVYDDDGYTETFLCFACCLREAEAAYEPADYDPSGGCLPF